MLSISVDDPNAQVWRDVFVIKVLFGWSIILKLLRFWLQRVIISKPIDLR